MDSLKISLLLLASLLYVHPSTAKKFPRHQNTRKVNSPQDDLKNCICFPDGPLPTVQQQLDTQNNGQERLVVYLYKNVATNEIKMYTPNADKQMLIPDIPYESGDGLITVTTEYVYQLLYNNPNIIKVYNDHYENLIPAVTDSLPIGLNTGEIEHIFAHTESYLNTNNNYNGNEYGLAKDIVVAVPHVEVVNRPPEGSLNMFAVPYDNGKLEILEQYGKTNDYSYLKPVNAQPIPLLPENTSVKGQAIPENPSLYQLQAVPENPQHFPSTPQAFPNSYVGGLDQHVVYTFQKDKLPTGSKETNTPHSTTFNIWFKQQMKRFQNIHLPNDIKTIDHNVLRILVQKTFYENNIYVSADGVITDAKGIVIDAANLELRPLLLGETLDHQILQNVQKPIKLPKHLPYLEGILVTFVSPPQILGIIPLGKTYLHQTLHTVPSLAGLTSVNGSKIYINSYENANAASPQVRSLTLKETAGPTTYYAYSGANGVPTSENSYTEMYNKAVAVAYPYSTENKAPQLSVSEGDYWSSGLYHTGSQQPYATANWNPSELIQPLGYRRILPHSKIEHLYKGPVKTRKRAKVIKNLSNKGVEPESTVEPFVSVNASESGRRFSPSSLAGVMKTLLYLLNDLPSRRDLNSTGNSDILNESESNNDGGAPDFRIIGGNAATGSGTPLSNKGRSGSIENA